MFCDATPSYPDDSVVLGRYLGPVMDVGSTLTAKILKGNGQVVYRSTIQHLTPDELIAPANIAHLNDFDTGIGTALGPSATWDDFPAKDCTPDLDIDLDDASLLGDDFDPTNNTPVLEPTPEVGDNYVMAEILLLRGNQMARGHVVSRKRDVDGQPIGRAHTNPILDTRQYNVWFNKREAIIKAVKSQKTGVLRKSHKLRIEVPTSVEYALRLDAQNGNTLWVDAIAAEMKEVKVAVWILGNNDPDPVGYQKIRCHMIFDVKMEDFCRKA